MSRETLQALRLQGKRVGVEFTSIVSIIQRLNRNAGDASQTNIRLRKDFEALGIGLENLRTDSPEEIFFKVADAVKEAESQGTRALRETLAIVGRLADVEGVALRGLLVQGGDALVEGAQALKDAGKIRAEEEVAVTAEAQAAAAEKLAEAQKALSDSLIAATPIIEASIPVLDRLATAIELVVKTVPGTVDNATSGQALIGGPAARGAGRLSVASPPALAIGTLADLARRLLESNEKTAENTADIGQWR